MACQGEKPARGRTESIVTVMLVFYWYSSHWRKTSKTFRSRLISINIDRIQSSNNDSNAAYNSSSPIHDKNLLETNLIKSRISNSVSMVVGLHQRQPHDPPHQHIGHTWNPSYQALHTVTYNTWHDKNKSRAALENKPFNQAIMVSCAVTTSLQIKLATQITPLSCTPDWLQRDLALLSFSVYMNLPSISILTFSTKGCWTSPNLLLHDSKFSTTIDLRNCVTKRLMQAIYKC